MNRSASPPRCAPLLACLFLAFLCNCAAADDSFTALAALRKAIASQPTPAASSLPEGEDNMREYSVVMLLTQLSSALSQPDLSQADAFLDQISATTGSDAVRQAVEHLRTVAHAERDARTKEAAQQFDSAFAAASKVVQTATDAAELDPVIDQFTGLMGNSQYGDPNRPFNQQAREALQFVYHWQDYLASSAADNDDDALNTLKSLLNGDYFRFIPRSQIVAKIDSLSKASSENPPQIDTTPGQRIRAIVKSIKSPDAIPAAMDALTTLQRMPDAPNRAWNEPISTTLSDLSSIYEAYSAYKSGLPTQLDFRNSQPDGVFPITLPVRTLFLMMVIPEVLGTDKPLQPDETLQQYLDRMMTDAETDADGPLMQRIHEVENAIGQRADSTDLGPLFASLTAAKSQEQAGEFAPAVSSYETALSSGSSLVPAQVIGERLAAIKKAHPDDYSKGMDMFLSGRSTPPQPRYYYGAAQVPSIVYIPGATHPTPAASPEPAPSSSPTH